MLNDFPEIVGDAVRLERTPREASPRFCSIKLSTTCYQCIVKRPLVNNYFAGHFT